MSDATSEDVLSRIVPWLVENVREPGMEITPRTELISQNLLDSMDLMRLVSFLEDSFDLSLDPDLLVPENFETPEKIAGLIRQVRP